jgi:hypothetical protein
MPPSGWPGSDGHELEVQMGSEGMDDREGGAMTDTGETAGGAASGDADLGRVRELVLQAHPDVVPDLVRGNSLDELLASVEPARSAYQQIAERVRGGSAGSPNPAAFTPPAVPAGGTRAALDPATLSPVTKIARALAERRRAA